MGEEAAEAPVEASDEHEVDRISDRRITLLAGGRYEYLVHWVGGDRTWEPDFNLEGCEESIKQYEEELRVALPNERDMSTDMEEYTTVYTDEHYHYQPPSENNEILHNVAVQRSQDEFSLDLLELPRYSEDHKDSDLAGEPMTQPDDEDPIYAPRVLKGDNKNFPNPFPWRSRRSLLPTRGAPRLRVTGCFSSTSE